MQSRNRKQRRAAKRQAVNRGEIKRAARNHANKQERERQAKFVPKPEDVRAFTEVWGRWKARFLREHGSDALDGF